jgi:hypothetical protein
MQFKEFNNYIKIQFKRMCNTEMLFKSNISGQQVWETYLNNFKPENNLKFRDPSSSEHNCNYCKNFIRRYGNILAIVDDKLESIFSNISNVGEYTDSVIACNNLLINSKIENVFFETYSELNNNLNYEKTTKTQNTFKLGIVENHKQYTKDEMDKFGVVELNKVYTFNHFNLDLPKQFVDFSSKSIEQITAIYKDKYSVFKRAMEEIPLDTLNLVADLIKQGSLLDGESHLHVVNSFITFKHQYNQYEGDKDSATWRLTHNLPENTAKFKNHLIGVLCTELAEGKELNAAVLAWNKRVDPINYHKIKAPITQAQINLAKKFVEENNYTESFQRRLATIDDIKASDILHINRDNSKVKTVNIFDNIKTPSGNGRHKRSEFDKIEEVGIDKFMSEILPNCTNVELFLENRMEGNLVNLTTSTENSKQIFKWNNPFSYTFNGNLAGKSQIKENVKAVGGKVEGTCLRASIQWNDVDTKGIVDFDLHAIEPDGTHIYYFGGYRRDDGNKFTSMTGQLDIDMINPSNIGIENIYWLDKNKMKNGKYRIFNKNYNSAQNTGFKAEIEFDGEIYNYHYSGNAQGDIQIATIILNNGIFTIEHYLPEISSSKQLWNIDTNQFHKINLVCLTPNHWEDNGIGNKHYLFFLQNCKNPNQVRGFHNEHLLSELLEHRKVLDVLGNTILCESAQNQLAGAGFNATVKDEVILRLSGSFKRVIKVKF